MTSKTHKLMTAMLVSGLALVSQSVFSSTTLTYQGAAFPSYQSGAISYADGVGVGYPDFSNKGVSVGGFKMLNGNTNQSITAWCVDVFDWLNSASYNNGNKSNLNNVSQLEKLVAQDYSKVNNATSSAAFQLAVWEIVNETAGSTSFSLSNGRFTASGSGLSAAITMANDWLQLNKANTGNYNMAYYIYGDGTMPNGVTQNLISMSPVPLPAALPLLLSGLGIFGFALRGKKKES